MPRRKSPSASCRRCSPAWRFHHPPAAAGDRQRQIQLSGRVVKATRSPLFDTHDRAVIHQVARLSHVERDLPAAVAGVHRLAGQHSCKTGLLARHARSACRVPPTTCPGGSRSCRSRWSCGRSQRAPRPPSSQATACRRHPPRQWCCRTCSMRRRHGTVDITSP